MTEHVALTYEQSRRMLLGTFTGPVEPWFRQLIARWLFLRLMFRRGDFGTGASQAPDFIQPGRSPVSSGDLLARLEAAVRDLETDLTAASNIQRTHVDHPTFGRLPLADLLRFLMIHTQHHQPQLSSGAVQPFTQNVAVSREVDRRDRPHFDQPRINVYAVVCMGWFAWLGLALLITVVAAITGIKPKGTRHVAHTRLMGGARLAPLALVIILAYLAFRARAGG